ncbi:sugar ABC transporter ATP-binding protein [Paenirhodobacter sp.]|uniref:sugar ABC transporter ATP-binding protein n=1 Tax=Paenirhodobacter sp. TaxID=1965326 RepID=UPI003B513A36
MSTPVLTASEVSKRFGQVQALRGVDFHVAAGEVHALLGINGAGKSTFIKILSAIIQKDGGTIAVAGRDVHFRTPEDALRAGIATVQQHPELVPDMTGLDNIFLGRETAKRGLFGRVDRAALDERARALTARFAVPIDLTQEVGRMSAVEREAVAILQALASDDIRVLILDEPTSTLTDVEREDLFTLMNQLKSRGIAIIYITHQLEEVFAIADSFSVFRGGTCVARMTVEEARAGRVSLAELMLGEAVGDIFPPRTGQPGAVVLEVAGLSRPGEFTDISLAAHRGEILGIFGLVGSGCDELSKAIFGALPPERGTIRLAGSPIAPKSPRQALDAGIFLVPGDRRTEGLALSRPALFNVPLANLRRAAGGRWSLRGRRMRHDAQELTRQVALHPPSLTTPASGFSGGNQQKIVLAKGLYSEAQVYIFVEPTVGVDIGARAKIYGLMRELSARAAVIVISSDCDEVHGVADRTVALHKGRLVAPGAGQFSRDALLMAGIMGEAAA